MLVSNANIKALNLYAESSKLHNSYYMAPSQRVPQADRRERCKPDSENLEEKREDPGPPQGKASLGSVLGHKDCGASVDPNR